MLLHGSDLQRISGMLAGLVLGLCMALPTQAFTPFSGPILSASLVAPNVVLLFDNSSSMVLNQVDGETRLEVAREATKTAIANNRHLRFGLFTFREPTLGDRGPGGVLLVEAGSVSADSAEGVARFHALNQALDGLGPDPQNINSTPLAESWYEVSRYLRGMRAFYPQTQTESARDAFVSPIEYRCQKNLGLIVTGGLPTYDDQFPDNLLDEPDGSNPQLAGSFNLPDWDGDNADLAPGAGPSTEGGHFYLDDIARFAHETDLRRGGTDQAGRSWDDPQFPLQNLHTSIIGFTLDDPRLGLVASAGNGRYFTASDRAQLQAQLQEALNDAARQNSAATGSGGGAGSDSQQLAAGVSRYYQTGFDAADWSGSLRAYQLNATGRPDTLLWTTDNTFTPGSPAGDFQTWRKAESGVAAGAVALDSNGWAALTPMQQQQLETEAQRAGMTGSDLGQRLLNWVKGSADADLRNRSRLLGDIIHSAPVLVGAGHHPLSGNQGQDYEAYQQQRLGSMTEAILVGANDGFLRLFDTLGQHLYSYLPAAAHSGLGVRARPDYRGGNQHRSGVDGRITVADARLGQHWSTLAAAGLGAGGKGLFAVRLFDAAGGNAARGVLWEVDADQLDALGHIYAQPVITRLNGIPVLITGNGYGSTARHAALLIFDLHSGALLKQLDVSDKPGAGRANGLSAPVLQFDANGEPQAAFAGDLHGQLWKFELTGSVDSWQAAYAGQPLFTAGEGQSITVQPSLHPNMTGDADLLLFGTGKLLEAVDLTDTRAQAFYAVLDAPSLSPGGLTPASLQQQRMSTRLDPDSGHKVRTVETTPVDWNSRSGWYVALDDVPGERVTRTAVIRHSRVMFTTGYIHTENDDPCLTHAGGWLMTVALDSGGTPASIVLDTNDDGRVDHGDIPAIGLELDVGLPGELSLIDRDVPGQQPGCSAEVYLVQGSNDLAVLTGQPECQFSRIMWRQLQ